MLDKDSDRPALPLPLQQWSVLIVVYGSRRAPGGVVRVLLFRNSTNAEPHAHREDGVAGLHVRRTSTSIFGDVVVAMDLAFVFSHKMWR